MISNIIPNDNFVFLFCFRDIFEHIWIGRDEFKLGSKHGSECEHVGSVDFVGPVIRCQCYQHQWLFLIVVVYFIRLNCKYEHIL